MAEGIGYFARLVAVELELASVLDAWHDAGHPDNDGEGAPTSELHIELEEAVTDAAAWFDSMRFLARSIEAGERRNYGPRPIE